MRKWLILGTLAAGALLLFAQEAEDWTARLAAWTAQRDIDSPVRNAIHLRQTVTFSQTNAVQTNIYRVPAKRRLALQQVAVYCTFTSGGNRLDQAHIATAVNDTVARYPLLRSTLESGLNYLATPVSMYADPGTPVEMTLGFNSFATGVCEITASGYSVQLNP